VSSTDNATSLFAADPVHSSFGFALRFLGGSIYRARFEQAEATLDLSGDGPTLAGSAKVESISIRFPDDFRNHVLGPDFFAAAEHPEIAFRSTSVQLGDDGATVEGELTVKGITRAVTATGMWAEPSVGPMGDQRSAISLQTTVNRRDFGMTWDAPLPGGGSALADEVRITVDLALVGRE
jgi:polyisoprenoid-binding protein YceI